MTLLEMFCHSSALVPGGGDPCIRISSASMTAKSASKVSDQLLQLVPSNWLSFTPRGMWKLALNALDMWAGVVLDVPPVPLAVDVDCEDMGWISVPRSS